MQHFRATLAFKPHIPLPPPCIFSICSLTIASCSWLSLYTSCFLFPMIPSGFFIGMLAVSRARSTELLHFLSSHPVDLICVHESNLNSSFSFGIPAFSALRSDHTHSRSGILSPDDTLASSSVIIFIKQHLSFSEISTSSLSFAWPLLLIIYGSTSL